MPPAEFAGGILTGLAAVLTALVALAAYIRPALLRVRDSQRQIVKDLTTTNGGSTTRDLLNNITTELTHLTEDQSLLREEVADDRKATRHHIRLLQERLLTSDRRHSGGPDQG